MRGIWVVTLAAAADRLSGREWKPALHFFVSIPAFCAVIVAMHAYCG